MSNLGYRIKSAREAAGMTQEQLGEKIGVTGVAIMRYEKSLREPRPSLLKAIAEALAVTPTYLLGYDQKIVNPKQYSAEELREIKDAAWASYEQYVEETAGGRAMLNAAFDRLNTAGQQKAVERVEELTEIPKYQKETPPQD